MSYTTDYALLKTEKSFLCLWTCFFMDPVIVKSSTPFILSVFLSLFQHESNDDGMFGPHLGGLDSLKT